jgi:hypothetical protein
MSKQVTILPLFVIILAGCGGGDGHGHHHERDNMLLADAGRYHAALTAHLSAQHGNELDIFFETARRQPKPAPLPLDVFTAMATTSDGQVHELRFEPAEPSERQDDPAGQCSHFVARAWWMKPDDKLTIVAQLPIDGKEVTVQWKNFEPQKYAHHHDPEPK